MNATNSTATRRRTAFKFSNRQQVGNSAFDTTNTTTTTASLIPTCTCPTGLK